MEAIFEEKRLEERARERCSDPRDPDPVEFAEALDEILRDSPDDFARARRARSAEAARQERVANPERAEADRGAMAENERHQREAEARWREESPELFGEPRKAPSAEAVRRARRLMSEAARIYEREGLELIHGRLLHESVTEANDA